MSILLALQVGLTLCVQITFLILATCGIQARLQEARSVCRLWTLCFIGIIGLTLAAIVLPHRRLFEFHSSISAQTLVNVVVFETWIARGLLVIWLTGVVTLFVRALVRYQRLSQFIDQRCEIITETQLACYGDKLPSILTHSKSANHELKHLLLLSSKETSGPFCWQLHRPVIVLPEFLLHEDELTIQHVLLHEIEHLRRQHPVQHLLQGFCSLVFWFHPAVWLAARRAELAREYVCDEYAAKVSGKVSDYLRTLARIAENCRNESGEPLTGGLAFGRKQSALVQRSNRLVRLCKNPSKHKPRHALIAFFSLIVIAIALNQFWLPTNVLASTRSRWSPWPQWTAATLHTFNIEVQDFEPYDERTIMHELLELRTSEAEHSF